MNRGTPATNYSEERSRNFAQELEKVGENRLAREKERLLEHLEEGARANRKGKIKRRQ